MRYIEECTNAINNYYFAEFGDANNNKFDNLCDVGLAYTTHGDNDEIEIQVSADIVNREFVYQLVHDNGSHVLKREHYSDETFLGFLEGLAGWDGFDGLVSDALCYVPEEWYEL